LSISALLHYVPGLIIALPCESSSGYCIFTLLSLSLDEYTLLRQKKDCVVRLGHKLLHQLKHYRFYPEVESLTTAKVASADMLLLHVQNSGGQINAFCLYTVSAAVRIS
jgi:hypothetical protein